jgi:hypothetical protein
MSACRISIEIEDPKRPRSAGETVEGTVVVQVDNDVRCKGLTVTSYWSTHGRGNTARGDVEQSRLYEGEWIAGQKYRYPFRLATATWPPTHYGTYLNVSHFVQAQASLPWATDPKATAEVVVMAKESPPDLAPTMNKIGNKSWLGWVLAPLAMIVLLIFIPLLLIVLVPLGIIGGIFWVIRVLIPRQVTGTVTLSLEPNPIALGDMLKGKCEFTPKRTSQINGISWTIKCQEKCVSGSGSNRSTHTHDVFTKVLQLAPAGTLAAGQHQSFELVCPIPTFAPPSLKLADNEINWTADLRIDIVKWPDWIKSLPFVVKPGVAVASSAPEVSADEESDEDRWLTTVLNQVLQCEDEPERLESVLEAIGPQTFAVCLDMQGETEEPFESEVEREGMWISAIDSRRQVRIALFVPHAQATEEMPWTKQWKGNVQIVGLEEDTRRVMMEAI